ncbi:SDR family oxidoreductase [Rhodococcus sp. BP-252]|nr:SDR family oxidoreductase [Rhodococcus sp. BP-320]MBY6415162.1 SDR family oxidoreductase [Rhodococcus sp. BP-321]MBY6421485.1 SDR family oxidoreductase [Rhodococcus sp. BP-324]MBY6425530.1 SDR family oxidoreductase [Rhodococcus sp. BP-323]MBY6430058.1 SDR family oxidoreductase [Rhodococcus sp. BP-322]MBY6438713.1 SDR family oxidoreductase [Rhodococcus sp. BP-319]MBY6443675.1 SDR family oxidoreductase [Rhodococcus sp. BP-318]MBY6448434.1 SDR family oxidoreductase [Rhodococcus sp. BP-315]M
MVTTAIPGSGSVAVIATIDPHVRRQSKHVLGKLTRRSNELGRFGDFSARRETDVESARIGKVALVTGGARGVGAGIARAFLRAGYVVVTCARREPESPVLDGLAHAEFLRCDVRRKDDVQHLVSTIVERHGSLDAVVNNAGGSPYALAADASPNFHRSIVELNLLAPLLVAQTANHVMQQQDSGGSIIMVSSVSARRPSPGTAAYGAAKAGLENLTGSLAVEWAPKVRVSGLTVGMVATERSALHYGDADGLDAVAHTVPLGRLATPDDVGASAVFLASPAASYITGTMLAVHGGGERPAFLGASNADRDREPEGGPS